MKEFEDKKTEYEAKIKQLKKEYNKTTDLVQKEYIKLKVLDLIKEMKQTGFINDGKLDQIETRIKESDNYGRIYHYSLAENLKEQITILFDSIQASPIHQKRLEIKNSNMIQFQDKFSIGK